MTRVRLTSRGTGVRVLTLDDPDRRNAIDRALRAELAEAVATVAQDPEARALVVTGAGSAFCAGANLPDILGDAGRPVEDIRADLLLVYESFLSLRRLEIPTIAAVHGPAVGAGLNLALACDLRVMGPRGYLEPNFARIGLHPGGGATSFLVDALGPAVALRVLLCAERIDAERAVEYGLAGSVDEDPVAAAVDLAERLAGLDPVLVRDIRATVRTATRGGFAAVVDAESWAQARSVVRNPVVRAPRRRSRGD